eukprot:4702247-Ditylum_brightwellii.AAC.1
MSKGGASTKVNTIIKKYIGVVEGVAKKMTSSGLHITAIDDMVFSHKINDAVAIMRGAWYFEGEGHM